MKEYYFIYKDSFGTWDITKNPVFIASHTYCRAIKKSNTKRSIKYIVRKLNKANTSIKIQKYLYNKYNLY